MKAACLASALLVSCVTVADEPVPVAVPAAALHVEPVREDTLRFVFDASPSSIGVVWGVLADSGSPIHRTDECPVGWRRHWNRKRQRVEMTRCDRAVSVGGNAVGRITGHHIAGHTVVVTFRCADTRGHYLGTGAWRYKGPVFSMSMTSPSTSMLQPRCEPRSCIVETKG